MRALLLGVLLIALGCEGPAIVDAGSDGGVELPSDAGPPPARWFDDVTAAAGVDATRPEAIGTAALDRALLAEFTEFLSDGARVRSLARPDPIFRERLRRRLWRTFLVRSARALRGVH